MQCIVAAEGLSEAVMSCNEHGKEHQLTCSCMICFQTGYLTAQTSGGSIVCRGLLKGDAELETKGSGVRLTLVTIVENSLTILVILHSKIFIFFYVFT